MLNNFLNTKPLFYDVIDYNRMPRVYNSIQKKIALPKIIHLVGTNGKGTTGRFLATALFSLGYDVGHYTSPHIVQFNERIWKNGKNISDIELEAVHKKLLSLLTPSDAEALSYFEYTTLLAILFYQDVEYLVFEAGLGGEYDATAVFENILTLITPIDFDHEAFLGDEIESIATTKLKAIQKSAIISKQKHQNISNVIKKIEEKQRVEIHNYKKFLDKEDIVKIQKIAKVNNLVNYLEENLSLAVAALKYLHIEYEVDDFKQSLLYGRLTQISDNVVLDVGHNVLAAESITKSLKGSKYILVYNSLKDKDYEKILQTLQPIIKRVEIIEIDDARAESLQNIENVLNKLGLQSKLFTAIENNEKYLVFGSFSVAEAFLKGVA